MFKLLVVVSGILGKEVESKINKEIKSIKNLTKMKYCKVGVEVHFKEAEGCGVSPNKFRRRNKRHDHDCDGCTGCQIIIVNPPPK